MSTIGKSAETYYLMYDDSLGNNSQNFFHLQIGYLLPMVHLLLHIEDRNESRSTRKYLIDSAGPIMNKVISDVLSLFQVDFQFIHRQQFRSNRAVMKLKVDRWESCLWKSPNQNSTFLNDLVFVRDQILKRVSSFTKVNGNLRPSFQNTFMLIKRSNPSIFTQLKGQKYGTASRYLDYEEGLKHLQKHIPIKLFQPGTVSIIDQINAFHECTGVIGLRGAEFVNVLWMKPGNKVILINPDPSSVISLSAHLARWLGHEYYELKTLETKKVKLVPEEILNILKPL